MIVSLSAISYFIYIDIRLTPTLVVIFVMIYNASFGFSWGPIPWRCCAPSYAGAAAAVPRSCWRWNMGAT